MKRRAWIFWAEDWDGRTFYLDAGGCEIGEDEAKGSPHIAADWACEAGRRAELWEAANNADVARVEAVSMGVAE